MDTEYIAIRVACWVNCYLNIGLMPIGVFPFIYFAHVAPFISCTFFKCFYAHDTDTPIIGPMPVEVLTFLERESVQ